MLRKKIVDPRYKTESSGKKKSRMHVADKAFSYREMVKYKKKKCSMYTYFRYFRTDWRHMFLLFPQQIVIYTKTSQYSKPNHVQSYSTDFWPYQPSPYLFINTVHMNQNTKLKSSTVADKLFTCLRINGEIRLPLKNAVNHSSTVSVSGIISICRLYLKHICTCKETQLITLSSDQGYLGHISPVASGFCCNSCSMGNKRRIKQSILQLHASNRLGNS